MPTKDWLKLAANVLVSAIGAFAITGNWVAALAAALTNLGGLLQEKVGGK